jgi:PKD domain
MSHSDSFHRKSLTGWLRPQKLATMKLKAIGSVLVILCVTLRASLAGSPQANAGGPYVLPLDGTITLDASKSSDPNGTIVSYGWDLNEDGIFGDSTAIQLPMTYNDFANIYGSPPPVGTPFTVCVRVADDAGARNTQCSTVIVIVPEPSSCALLTLGGLALLASRLAILTKISRKRGRAISRVSPAHCEACP